MSEDQLGELKLKDARGAEITGLDHDGPACKAGMRMHDVILQMNGQVIETEDQLRRLLREIPIGRTVNFVVSRDGQTQTMTMTTADRRMVGVQAWEQHYSVPAPGPSGLCMRAIASSILPRRAPRRLRRLRKSIRIFWGPRRLC